MDEATRLGELIHDSLIAHTGSARTMGSFHVAEDVLAAGYVRLDVDVEALREAVEHRQDEFKRGMLDYLSERNPIWLLARQVLAALDGEEA